MQEMRQRAWSNVQTPGFFSIELHHPRYRPPVARVAQHVDRVNEGDVRELVVDAATLVVGARVACCDGDAVPGREQPVVEARALPSCRARYRLSLLVMEICDQIGLVEAVDDERQPEQRRQLFVDAMLGESHAVAQKE